MKYIKTILTSILIIFIISMLWLYWFMGVGDLEFSTKPRDPSFSLSLTGLSQMQFYENLRYRDSNISYKISDKCTLQKKSDATRAFEILENITILDFYDVNNNEEILVSCQSQQVPQGGFFVAGEGGPVNITKSGEFRVIEFGKILLIRDSKCSNPNVAIHEILHALGFGHSKNSDNIMYNTSKCSQEIGKEIPELINSLYSIPSEPDLVLENITPETHQRYLDINLSVKNSGLQDSEKSIVKIYADSEVIKSIDVKPLEIGTGIKFMLKNIPIKKFNELRVIIDYEFNELNKKNNEIVFEAS